MSLDLSGYGLDEENQTKLQAAIDANIEGLKNKNSELIEREKSAKEKSEAAEAARVEAEEAAKVAAAEKSGDVDKYKQALEEAKAAREKLQEEFDEKNRIMLHERAIDDFVSGNISADPAARLYMKDIYKKQTKVDGGKVVPVDVTLTPAELIAKIKGDESFAPYIKVNAGSGAGAAGSESSAGSASTKEMSPDEKRAAAINKRFGK